MSAEGAVLFARYAYPPNELGYCGPAGAAAMLDRSAVADIEQRARQFEGAWSYLEFLAESLGGDDPLAAEVVEAYWVGSDLLDAVDAGALLERLVDRFGDQPGGSWRSAARRARAHHSFQVFEVYPWVRLLAEGRPPGPAVNVLDQCRIRVGVVEAVDGGAVSVRHRPLIWDGSTLEVGDETTGSARWSVDGRALMASPEVGDLVALHWDWVCDVLTPDQARRICRLEEHQRAAVFEEDQELTGGFARRPGGGSAGPRP